MHPRTGHTWSLLSGDGQASRLRAARFVEPVISRSPHDSGTRLATRMSSRSPLRMKRILLALLLFIASLGVAQTPQANQEQKLLALIKEVQTQQTQMTENQAKIEEKLAKVAETDSI